MRSGSGCYLWGLAGQPPDDGGESGGERRHQDVVYHGRAGHAVREGEHHGEVTLENSLQKPGQSPGGRHIVLGVPQLACRVRHQERGRVASEEAREELHCSVRVAQHQSPRHHATSCRRGQTVNVTCDSLLGLGSEVPLIVLISQSVIFIFQYRHLRPAAARLSLVRVRAVPALTLLCLEQLICKCLLFAKFQGKEELQGYCISGLEKIRQEIEVFLD